MDTNELFKRVRRVEIKTRALTANIFAGEYHSAFKGRGMSFAEVRSYQPGDDVRDIDWNVTARTGRAHVKVFEEERELTVMLLIDVSASLNFGTRERSMREMIAEIAATIAFSASQTGDQIGAIFFSDRIEAYIPPKKGHSHILRLVRELLTIEPQSPKTNLPVALEFLVNVQRRRSIAFLLSDFIDAHNAERQLMIAARRHDLIALRTTDQMLTDLPNVGLLNIRDAETGHEDVVDTSSRAQREAYRTFQTKKSAERTETLQKLGVDSIDIATDADYVKALIRLFSKRSRR